MYFPTLTAGDLRHVITIQNNIRSNDEEGIPGDGWNDYMDCYAAVVPLGGREAFIAQATEGKNPYLFRIRYNSKVNETMRIIYAGRKFRINNVNDVNERHRELQITCIEEIKNG